jgi:putative ABC transport system permease protein
LTLTLALGIGANSAIFSVMDTVLLRPLPFENPDNLVVVWNVLEGAGRGRDNVSFPDFYDYRAQSRTFAKLAYYGMADTVLSGAGEAQAVSGVVVGGDFFETLNAPVLGRGFTSEEAKVGGPDVVVISHGLWQRAFASNPGIIGQQITLTSRTYTILGVMERGWKFPVEAETSDFIIPWEPLEKNVTSRSSHALTCLGRLKTGVSIRQAEAEMKSIAAQLARQYPDTNAGRSVELVSLFQEIVGHVRPALLILLGAVVVVLFIACANLANLLLARSAARSREMGILAALGASRARIIRQLLIESLMLALIGGICGSILAWCSVELLRAFGPRNVPRLSDVHISFTVGLFTLTLTMLSTILFGVVPALQSSRNNLVEALQERAKGSTGGPQGTFIRAALVVSQVSLSLLLLIGAGLLIRSFLNLQSTDLGFDPTRLLVLYQFVPRTYSEIQKQRDFYG